MRFILFLILATGVLGKDSPDPRLKAVNAVFVKGNNQAAEAARKSLKSGKTCLSLADKESVADAILEIGNDAQTMGGTFGSLGARTNVVSATLTLNSGELVWSRSERASDAPFMSGAKSAGNSLVSRLATDCACKQRK